MRPFARLAALCLLAAASAAGARADDDDKSYELKLLPPVAKGQEEEITIETSVERPGKDAASREGDSLQATLQRRIKAVADGLASREVLTLEKADLAHYEAGRNGSSSRTSTGLAGQSLTFQVERRGSTRRAVPEEGGKFPAPAGVPDDLVAALRRDPDGLATLVAPDEPMAVGDEWNVNRADLLALFGPSKIELDKTGSRATATLQAVEKKDDRLEATIAVTASLNYKGASSGRLKVRATLTGVFDGSAAPRVEEVVLTFRDDASGKKVVTTKIHRTAKAEAKPEKKRDPDKNEEAPGKKKPPAEKDKKPDEDE